MNIQNLNSPIAPSTTPTVGGRLDVRSDAPASAHRTESVAPRAAEPSTPRILENAGLLGVLNPQEQQALGAAFGEAKPPTYSGGGITIGKPPVLGTQVDFQA